MNLYWLGFFYHKHWILRELSYFYAVHDIRQVFLYATPPRREHPLGINDGLFPPLDVIPSYMPTPLPHPTDVEDIEIYILLESENRETVIISDDEDDEPIVSNDEDVKPMSIDDDTEAKKDPNDIPYTPRIHSQVTPDAPSSSHLSNRIASHSKSSSRIPIDIPSSLEYSSIRSPEYTPETPSPR